MSELAIHALLVETRARDLDREVSQDTNSDRHLLPSEKVFDNAADDLEMIAVSKCSMSLDHIRRQSGLIFNRSNKRQSPWQRFGVFR